MMPLGENKDILAKLKSLHSLIHFTPINLHHAAGNLKLLSQASYHDKAVSVKEDG